MANVKTVYFHIKGKPTAAEISRDHDENGNKIRNYIMASVNYVKGIGYVWDIRPISQFTWHDSKYVDLVMNSIELCITKKEFPEIWHECLVPCQRRGKAKEREAVELFDSNVVSAIINRLGYDIEGV